MATGTGFGGHEVAPVVHSPDEQSCSLKEPNVTETLDNCAFGMNGLISIPAASRPRAYGIASKGQDLVADDNLGVMEMGSVRT